MKSTIRKRTYEAIYRLLDKVSPVSYDCGTLCGAACCTCDSLNSDEDFDMGIYLLPGEEKLFTRKEEWLSWTSDDAENYDFPDSWSGKVFFIRCKTPPVCERKMRPIQCRTYPLAPHIDAFDRLVLIYNANDLPYNCPLIEKRIPLEKSFIKATYTAWKHLIRDPYIYDLVEFDSICRDYDEIEYEVIEIPE